MYSQPLHLIKRSVNGSEFYVSGNVTIDPSVAIATGVLIQADIDSQIVIALGTCIGKGAIIHAHGGIIDIGAGVTIGAEVLIIGKSKIGAHACIGSRSTILDHDLAASEVLPLGSLLGDTSRHIIESSERTLPEDYPNEVEVIDNLSTSEDLTVQAQPEYQSTYVYDSPVSVSALSPQPVTPELMPSLAKEEPTPTQKVDDSTYVYETSINQKVAIANAPSYTSSDGNTSSDDNKGESIEKSEPQVYGQANLNRLLDKLLPHRQALNLPSRKDS